MTEAHLFDPLSAVKCFFALPFLLLGLTGCGSGEFRPVSGTITVDGQPLESGRVVFSPIGEGRKAYGNVKDGAYQLTTQDPQDGAKPGEYIVTINAVKTISDGPVAQSFAEEMAGVGANTKSKTVYLVNQKYSSKATSDLKATVADSGSNNLPFEVDGPDN